MGTLRAAETIETGPFRGAAAHSRGLLARTTDDFSHWFTEARRLFDQTGMPFYQARTRLCYGERLRRAGRRVEARAQLRPALAIFERLGATPWAEHAAAEIRASGETLRRRPKTIELHLSRVYRKLGVRSRTELARVIAKETAPAGVHDTAS